MSAVVAAPLNIGGPSLKIFFPPCPPTPPPPPPPPKTPLLFLFFFFERCWMRPAHGCLNIHASLLPRWRGGGPPPPPRGGPTIHRAVMAGDAEISAVTIIADGSGAGYRADAAQGRRARPDTKTTGALTDELAALGAAAMVEVLADLPALLPGTAG